MGTVGLGVAGTSHFVTTYAWGRLGGVTIVYQEGFTVKRVEMTLDGTSNSNSPTASRTRHA